MKYNFFEDEMFQTGFIPSCINAILFCLSFAVAIAGIIAGIAL